MKFIAIFFLLTMGAFAQLLPVPVNLFPPGLREYLMLTDAQVQTIVRLNADYTRTVAEKSVRIAQVQREINEQLRREQPDPVAVGSGYVEMEFLRRQMQIDLAPLRNNLRAALNDAQRAKLKTLEDAQKLEQTVNEAVCTNLLAPLPTPVLRFGDFVSGGDTSSLIAGSLLGIPAITNVSCASFNIRPLPLTP